MKHLTSCAALCCFIFIITGCSPVKFYSGQSPTTETGLKYYSLKPFLQVERDLVSRNIVKAEVIYIADLSTPQYLKLKDGPGSRKLDLKLKDGTISELGISTDAKASESVEALASLIDKSAEAAKDLTTFKGTPGTTSQNIVEFYEIIMSGEGTKVKRVEF